MDANKRRARAAAEAAEWWVRIESGELSLEDRREFVDWLRESALHVAEMLHMAEVHGVLEQFTDWARVSTEGWEAQASVVTLPERSQRGSGVPAETADYPTGSPRRAAGRWWIGAAAASLLAAFGAWWFLTASLQTIETGRGERRGVTLADGSVVQIDPQSLLRIRLEQHERTVYLERGRALFRVAHDPGRPFLVHADAAVVRAIGTQFGVEEAREGVIVTVAEGKVSVGSPADNSTRFDGTSKAPAVESSRSDRRRGGHGDAAVFLTAGQQLTVPRSGPAEPVRQVDTSRELAWASGRLVFDNESVAAAIEQFNRYNVVQLHVADPQLASRSVSAVFDASEPESFIRFIESVAPVRVIRSGQDITIASPP